MAKRRRHYNSSDSESGASSNSSDDEYLPASKRPKKQRTPTTKAEITVRATDTPLDGIDAQKRVANIDPSVLERIRKALTLADGTSVNEAEARQALRVASRLLEQHNVSQADVMAQETDSERLTRAGQSTVSIKSTVSPTTAVNSPSWTHTVADVVDIVFGTQSYTTNFRDSEPRRVEWTFYGLAEPTVAAVHAFEMIYNLIIAWSLKQDIGQGVHHRNCYCTGIAEGLHTMAEEEKEQAGEKARMKEEALLQTRQEQEAAEELRRLDRLKDKTEGQLDHRVKIEEVEDEDCGRQNVIDVDEFWAARDKQQRPVNERRPSTNAEVDDESPWDSVGQLVAFRERSSAIGKEYLKQHNIKVYSGRMSRPLEFRDLEARQLYRRGEKDAEKIDVHRKRIKDVDMD